VSGDGIIEVDGSLIDASRVMYVKPSEDNCNGGDCQRHKLGAEPCTDCPYCDERGNI